MRFIFLSLIMMLCIPVLVSGQNKRTMRRLEKQVKEARIKDSLANVNNAASAKPKNHVGDALPDFRFVNSKQQLISRDDLPKGKPVLLILFNPMCDHCQKVAMNLDQHKEQFSDVSILFITGMNLLGELENFINESHLTISDHFIIGAGNEEFTAPLFESNGIPQIMAYDKEWKLKAVFVEHIDIDKTLEALGH